jgi:hypothetical protein
MEVTKELLIKNGFIQEERILGLPVVYYVWTKDLHPYKLDITLNHEYNNTMKRHYVPIDNNVCSSVGNLEFDTVEQFNLLMEALGSNFRLKA